MAFQKEIWVAAASMFFAGCASIRNENVAVPIESGSGPASKDIVNSSNHKKSGYLEKMRIKYLLNGRPQEAELKFRSKESISGSKWQDDVKPTFGGTGFTNPSSK